MARLTINPNSYLTNSNHIFTLDAEQVLAFNKSISSLNQSVWGIQPSKEQIISGITIEDLEPLSANHSLCATVYGLDQNVDTLKFFSQLPFSPCSSFSDMVETARNPYTLYLTPISAGIKDEEDPSLSSIDNYEWVFVTPNPLSVTLSSGEIEVLSGWDATEWVINASKDEEFRLSSISGGHFELIGTTSMTDDKLCALFSDISGTVSSESIAIRKAISDLDGSVVHLSGNEVLDNPLYMKDSFSNPASGRWTLSAGGAGSPISCFAADVSCSMLSAVFSKMEIYGFEEASVSSHALIDKPVETAVVPWHVGVLPEDDWSAHCEVSCSYADTWILQIHGRYYYGEQPGPNGDISSILSSDEAIEDYLKKLAIGEESCISSGNQHLTYWWQYTLKNSDGSRTIVSAGGGPGTAESPGKDAIEALIESAPQFSAFYDGESDLSFTNRFALTSEIAEEASRADSAIDALSDSLNARVSELDSSVVHLSGEENLSGNLYKNTYVQVENPLCGLWTFSAGNDYYPFQPMEVFGCESRDFTLTRALCADLQISGYRAVSNYPESGGHIENILVDRYEYAGSWTGYDPCVLTAAFGYSVSDGNQHVTDAYVEITAAYDNTQAPGPNGDLSDILSTNELVLSALRDGVFNGTVIKSGNQAIAYMWSYYLNGEYTYGEVPGGDYSTIDLDSGPQFSAYSSEQYLSDFNYTVYDKFILSSEVDSKVNSLNGRVNAISVLAQNAYNVANAESAFWTWKNDYGPISAWKETGLYGGYRGIFGLSNSISNVSETSRVNQAGYQIVGSNNAVSVIESTSVFREEPTIAIGSNSKIRESSIVVGNESNANWPSDIVIGSHAQTTRHNEYGTNAPRGPSIAIGFMAGNGWGSPEAPSATGTIAIGGPIYQPGTEHLLTAAVASADFAIQLGAGTNTEASSFQVYDWQLLNHEGKIPTERIEGYLPLNGGIIDTRGTSSAKWWPLYDRLSSESNNYSRASYIFNAMYPNRPVSSDEEADSVERDSSVFIGNGSQKSYTARHWPKGAVAIGGGAVVSAQNADNAIQLGAGTNKLSGTFQVRDWQLLDDNGDIPEARLSSLGYMKKSAVAAGMSELSNLLNFDYSNPTDETMLSLAHNVGVLQSALCSIANLL